MKYTSFLTAILLFAGTLLISSNPAHAQLDPTFGTNGISQTNIFATDAPVKSFLLPSGKILLVNRNTLNLTQGQYSFVLFNHDGSLDTNYGSNGVVNLNIPFLQPASGIIEAIERQADGKLLLVGSDNEDGIIIRFNDNGSLDTTLGGSGVLRPNIDQSQTDRLTSIAVQPDGKILLAGYSTGFSLNKPFLIRYHSNGFLDQSFGSGGFIVHGNLPAPVKNRVLLQSTGKFLVPLNHSPSEPLQIYRFNADGSVDSGFTPIGMPFERIGEMLIQPDDKILISRAVGKNDTLERVHTDAQVTRFNANGALDADFGTGGSASVDVAAHFDEYEGYLGLLSDGQIVVSTVSNITANRSLLRGGHYDLVRLSPDGEVNGKFIVAGKNNFGAVQILIQPDDRIVGVTTRFLNGGNYDILMARVTGVPFQNYKFRANPFDFGSANSLIVQDGKADVTVFRENQSNWYIKPMGNPFLFGLAGDIPIPRDYIKDYGTEIAIFRPSTGIWYIGRDFSNPGQNFIALPWGRMGDIPIPFDHDGDTKADVAVFRPSDGNWYIRNSADDSVGIVRWGMNGDKPVPGDYDGDGKEDIAVWRPSNGVWYILRSSDLQPMYLNFGIDGDIPVQEDFDGDGKTDIAVWRPADGVWYIRRSSDGSFNYLQWGAPGDMPTPSDFDGDLKTDFAVWRPGDNTWYIFQSSSNTSIIFPYGTGGDVPVQRRN